MNSLRENQSTALDETRNEVQSVYQSQVASLQQSLVQSERSLQALERQLAETKNSHSNEIDSILRQQEAIRNSALQERDEKHVAQIQRLTDKLTAQQEFADGARADSDEQEAERIRMIKESMKDLHEKEKVQMIQAHETEKMRMTDEFRKQMESSTQQMEQVANFKIQEMHSQFMSAHQTLLQQKTVAESEVEQLRSELRQITAQNDLLTMEKHTLEEQYHTILESHSAEVEEMSLNAHNLEERVNTWKEKAANLESHLSGESGVREQYETRLQNVTAKYNEQVAGLEALVKEHVEKNALLHEQLQRAEESQLHHREDFEELKSQHGSQVELLEKSMSEASSDRAAAEEHMINVQKQLKAYRMQESDMNAKMTELQEEHAVVVELLKQRYEREKEAELETLRSQFTLQIEELQKELAITQSAVHSQLDIADSDTPSVQELQLRHTEELVETRKALHESHTQALASLRAELEDAHQKSVELLKQQHGSELEQLRSKLELAAEQLTKIEADRVVAVNELKEAHGVQIEELQAEHSQAMKQLQQSLEEKENSAQSEVNSRILSLESELSKLRTDETEWVELYKDMMSRIELSQREKEESESQLAKASSTEAQLREQCQGLNERIQSMESDCHIAQNDRARMQQSLEHSQAQVDDLTAKIVALEGEMGDVEAIETASREQAQKLLKVTEQLAERNATIAELQSQNDILNTEVFSLTQKCQQQVSSIEMLQRQIENTGAVSEEITTLQQQLSALAPIKEHYAQLKHSLTQLEVAVQTKDGEIGVLQSKLELFTQMQEQVAQLEAVVQSKDREIGLQRAELEDHALMKEKANQLESAIQSKDAEINSLRSDLEQAGLQMRETSAQLAVKLEEVNSSSARETEAFKAEIASYRSQESELRRQIQQQVMSLAQIESTHSAQQEELSSAKEELGRLQGQLQEALSSKCQLQDANQMLSAEVETLREHSTSEQTDSLAELQRKYSELEHSFATISSEKERLASELQQVQEEGHERVKECQSSWEVRVQQLEETIGDLRSQLNAKEHAFVELQSEMNQKLAEAKVQEQYRHQSLDSSQYVQGEIGLVAGHKSVLEESLSRARRKLTEKLREKEAIEKDLTFHRTELERRLGEKQHLEGLLFEKARFEQELMNQKEQLQSDLLQIESKLQLQVGQQQKHRLASVVTAHY